MAIVPNTNKNVDIGTPKVGGYSFIAPLAAALPTDATTALADEYVNLGYISQEGVKHAPDRSTTDHKEWGSLVVETTQDEYKETVTATYIESLRGDLLKAIYGPENVTIVEPSSGQAGLVTINSNGAVLENGRWVWQMKSRRSERRMIAGNARPTAIGEVTFASSSLITYQLTITAYPDENGNLTQSFVALPALP